MYNFISDDFSYVQQILLMLRKDELPLEMNLALSDFTTISTAREREVPVLSANHCSLTVNDLLLFGKMKPTNTRKKGTETTYKWYSNKKNDRGFGQNIMSYAEELLKNASTISIPHTDSIDSLIESIDDAIERSRDIDDGIFSFQFIQFFLIVSMALEVTIGQVMYSTWKAGRCQCSTETTSTRNKF